MMSATIARWLLSGTDAPVVTAAEIETDEELAVRNAERLAAAKQALGQRYLLHPSNRISRRGERAHVVQLSSVGHREPSYTEAA